ncbi:MAG: reverse transcriptase N-terminal domain-containing protein [Trichodesmium sp. St16_bin4-tuft]|mgnify:FL=1|nr:reverse transcriptase N-terminal domain-containing protein [Trichodesmium sp. ALOHA_ZT_67]MDE5091544.1 reverse transcriptase N-terminal domain-containing protein [Trichodesmium sp. St18_bin3_1_1]MDE5099235.1 reverse transcriptase N-terminal domain-containing protein [Trichodesmium sp. St16_bin4-tuft]
MKKARTLKNNFEHPKQCLRVAWGLDDIPSKVCVNHSLKWKNIEWKKIEKYVFKLPKLIYRASSPDEICFSAQILKTSEQKLLLKIACWL